MKLLAFVVSLAFVSAAQVRAAAPVPPKSYPAEARAMIEAARADCLEVGGKSMKALNGAVEGVDLNGDGRQDYLINFGQFQCSNAASLWCGTAGCNVVALVGETSGRYREVPLSNLRDYRVVKADGLTLLEVHLHGSACGQTGAYDCVKRLRYANGKFEQYPPAAATKAVSITPASAPAARWQLMTLRNGQKVAFVKPGGRISSLSLGCQAGGPTMMIEIQPGSVVGTPAVVLRGANGVAQSARPASRQNNLIILRPVSGEMTHLFNSANPVALEIGQASMSNVVTTGASAALSAALSGCKPVRQATVPIAEPSPAPMAAAPAGPAATGVMGIPIRQGYYVAEYEQCRQAGTIYRFGPRGHAEADATSRQFVEIPWRKAVRSRGGDYVVQYMPLPGEMAGDEIEIMIKPLSETRLEITIQDNVILRLCDRSQLPSWVP